MSKEYLTLVYKYGLLGPVEGADAVEEQIRCAHAYRNTLTALTREERQARRDVPGTGEAVALHDQISDLSGRIEEILENEKRGRADRAARLLESVPRTQRKRVRVPRAPISEEAATEIASLRAQRKALGEALAAVQAANRPAWTAAKRALAERWKPARKAARAETRTFWCTYQLVEDAVNQADMKTRLWDRGESHDPRFRRYDGSGQVSVQIQPASAPKRAEALFTPTARHMAWIDKAASWRRTNKQGTQTNRNGKLYPPMPLLRMRLCKTGGGGAHDFDYAAFPIVWHRDIPAGCEIQRITVSRTRSGPRAIWSAEFTVRMAAGWTRGAQGPSDAPACAYHFGYAAKAGGLVVASWLDTTGAAGQLVLPSTPGRSVERLSAGYAARSNRERVGVGIVDRLEKPAQIRSIRDLHFDVVKGTVVRWMGENAMPGWLAEKARWVPQWRSPRRLVGLYREWAQNRIEGDSILFTALEAWAKRDRHLWEYEEGQRRGALAARRDVYRCFAAREASARSALVIDSIDYSAIARRPRTEDEGANKTAQANRFIAAIGMLRMTVEQAARMRGTPIVTLDAEQSKGLKTQCPACGHDDRVHDDHAGDFVCVECGYRNSSTGVALLNKLKRAGYGTAVDDIIKEARRVSKELSNGSAIAAA